MMLLPSKGLTIQNGIRIHLKKTVGYAANVSRILYTTNRSPPFIFVEVFVSKELQSVFVTSVAERRILKKAGYPLMTIIYGIDIQRRLENGCVVSVMQIGYLNRSENSKPKMNAISTLESYLAEMEIQCMGTTL